MQRVPSVGFELGLLWNGDNSSWLSERREVNGGKYWGRAMGARQPLRRMPQAEGGLPYVPEHTHRQPGKDQEEQEMARLAGATWMWETCGRGDRLVQSFVDLGQRRHQNGKHPGEDLS